jgi:hypothetical protein
MAAMSRGLLLLMLATAPACAYRMGGGVVAGAVDELGGNGRTEGLQGITDDLIERALLVELGHQLGEGLSNGATTVTPEQEAALQRTIDSILTVAAERTGKGLRNEVSPELREMVRKDIVGAFSDSLRDDLGPNLESTVDRVVTRAVQALRLGLDDPETRFVLSDLLRDSIYLAMRESQASPAVGETIKTTLEQDMLSPIEQSVGGITSELSLQWADANRRTEATLKGIITVMALLMAVGALLYMVRNRQVRRLQEINVEAERGLRNVDAALQQLDESTRAQILGKLQEYEQVEKAEASYVRSVTKPPPPPPRPDDYVR